MTEIAAKAQNWIKMRPVVSACCFASCVLLSFPFRRPRGMPFCLHSGLDYRNSPKLFLKHVLSASALPPIMEAEIMDPARRPSTPHRLRFGQLGVLVVPKAVKLGGGVVYLLFLTTEFVWGKMISEASFV